MNGRIKELAKQSGLPAWTTDDTNSVNIANKFEKFAELIVRECLYEMENTSSGDMDFAIWKIKKDFGIE